MDNVLFFLLFFFAMEIYAGKVLSEVSTEDCCLDRGNGGEYLNSSCV